MAQEYRSTWSPSNKIHLHAQCCSWLAGFKDPFDPLLTITLNNEQYRIFGFSLMAGKLDWMLLRRCQVMEKTVGNHDYAASDHKWLMTRVILTWTLAPTGFAIASFCCIECALYLHWDAAWYLIYCILSGIAQSAIDDKSSIQNQAWLASKMWY